jgi:hypothetical protein
MPVRATAMNADQERTLVVLLLILCFWKYPTAHRVDAEEFHQTVEYALTLLEIIRPGTIARLGLTRPRIKHIVDYTKAIQLIKEEARTDTSILSIHAQAGPRINRMIPDFCQDLEERTVITRTCGAAVQWYVSTLRPDLCCE